MREQQGRPGRKRDATRDGAILQATLDVLAVTAYERMTTDMVAARAGVSKATMYRRWSSKAQLVVEAVGSLRDDPAVAPSDSGSLAEDLASLLDTSRNGSAPGKFKILTGLLSAQNDDADLARAVRRHIVKPRTAAIRLAIEREQARGGISRDADLDMLALVVAATISYRLLVTGDPVDRRFLAALVDKVITTR